jgi:hypothetical protein
MSTQHRVAMMCDGCNLVHESSPDKYPTLILELKEEGWVFQYDVHANIIHRDFCPECVAYGIESIWENITRERSNEQ